MPEEQKVDGPSQNTVMGILAYFGILVLIPFFVSKNDPFVKFHVKQGMVLFGIEIILWIVGTMLWSLWFLINFINIALFILAIVGIVNVVKHREKELPIVGSLSKYLTF